MSKLKSKWEKAPRGKKISVIVSLCIWLILIVLAVLLLFAKDIFGPDSIWAKVLANDNGDATDVGRWFSENWTKFVATAFYIVVFIGGSKLLRFLLSLIFSKSKRANTIVKLLNSFIKYAAVIIMILVILGAWGVNTSTLLASAGILALVVGLGAQPLIADIISGLFIVFETDYEVGDIIVVDDFRGVVQEIGLRNTKLVDDCGNIKVINNSKIGTIVNMTKDYSLAICDIPIDYEEDLKRVEKIINDNLVRIQQNVPELVEVPKYFGVQELADSGINLRVVGRCKEEDRFRAVRHMNRELFLIFNENNVNVPFNQIVVSQREEKK
ncbi:MAG: mechanosensitive ion channel family protein [Bacilli bacterium]